MQAIAAQGKFGETEDDVLRRVFNLPEHSGREEAHPPTELGNQQGRRRSYGPRKLKAERKMSSFLSATRLHVSFQDGASQSWLLPQRSDKREIRSVRDKAVAFAGANGATIGQVHAVMKALTNAGYYLRE